MYHRLKVAGRNFTRRIDIFGSGASLYINGDPTYRTSTGGCFSILFVFAVLSYLYYSFKGLVDRKTFTYTFTEEFIETPLRLNVTDPTLYMAVMILVNQTTFLNVSQGNYFNVTINQVDCPVTSNVCNVTSLGVQPCQANLFPDYPAFNGYVAGGICPENNNFVLDGQPLGDLYKGISSNYIEILVTPCNQSAQNNSSIKCKEGVNISQILNTTEFEIYVFYTNNFVDVSNYEYPVQQLVGYSGGRISPYFIEMYYTEYLDELSISTNDGFITSSINTIISYSLDPLSEIVFGHAPTSQNQFFKMQFRRSQLGSVYTRQYLSLSSVMSEVGGLAISLRKILGLIVAMYASFKYKVFVTNTIYAFKGVVKKKFVRRQTTISIDTNNEKENAMIALNGSVKIGEFLIKASVPRYNKEGRINAGFWEFIRNLIPGCRGSQQMKMIKKAEENIIVDTDIMRIVKTFREVERIEQIVLSKDEILLFETMHDPFSAEHIRKITVAKDNMSNFSKEFNHSDPFYRELEEDKLEAMNELYRAWYTTSTKVNKTYQDEKLLEMMDPDIVAMFESFKAIVGGKFDNLPLLFIKSIKRLKASQQSLT